MQDDCRPAFLYVVRDFAPIIYHSYVVKWWQESGELFVCGDTVGVDLRELGKEMLVGDRVEETGWWELHG